MKPEEKKRKEEVIAKKERENIGERRKEERKSLTNLNQSINLTERQTKNQSDNPSKTSKPKYTRIRNSREINPLESNQIKKRNER